MIRRTAANINKNMPFSDPLPSNRSINGPIAVDIRSKIFNSINVNKFEMLNETYKHAGHFQVKQGGLNKTESHFKLLIISDDFQGLSLMKRHRMVFTILDDIMDRIHSLQLVTRTIPEQAKKEPNSKAL